MFNPIKYVTDIVHILRNPFGEATSALEITDANAAQIALDIPESAPYVHVGDYVVVFENGVTIAPRSEFFKHYEFIEGESPDRDVSTPIRTIKPL